MTLYSNELLGDGKGFSAMADIELRFWPQTASGVCGRCDDSSNRKTSPPYPGDVGGVSVVLNADDDISMAGEEGDESMLDIEQDRPAALL